MYILIYVYIHKLRIRNSRVQNQNAREQERPEVTQTTQESVWALAMKYGSHGQPGFARCTPDAQKRGENRSVSKTDHGKTSSQTMILAPTTPWRAAQTHTVKSLTPSGIQTNEMLTRTPNLQNTKTSPEGHGRDNGQFQTQT